MYYIMLIFVMIIQFKLGDPKRPQWYSVYKLYPAPSGYRK